MEHSGNEEFLSAAAMEGLVAVADGTPPLPLQFAVEHGGAVNAYAAGTGSEILESPQV